MYYVVDTHAFIWYLVDDPRLSKKAKEIFALSDIGRATLIVSAVVMLECMAILEKKKVKLNFEEILLKISQASNFIFAEINFGLIIETNRIKGTRDLHDRVIIATAKLYGADLVSKDAQIRKIYQRTVW